MTEEHYKVLKPLAEKLTSEQFTLQTGRKKFVRFFLLKSNNYEEYKKLTFTKYLKKRGKQ